MANIFKKDDELDNTLLSLTTNNPTNPLPAAIKNNTPTVPLPNEAEFNLVEQAKIYERDLQKAYPDQKIKVSVNADGSISAEHSGRPFSAPTFANPNFQPEQAASGLDMLKDQLVKATTNEEKLNIALSIKRLAQDQQVSNYNKYKQQAEAKFGIPDLEMAID